MSNWRWSAGLAALVMAAPALAQAPKDPVQGTWRPDPKASGGAGPAMSLGTDAAGNLTIQQGPASGQFVGRADGKTYPVQGTPDYRTMSAQRGADGSLRMTERVNGGASTSQSCSLSQDKKQLTCEGTTTDANGAATPFKHVYERQ